MEKDASHFSQLALRDEYLLYTDISFNIPRKDASSLTKMLYHQQSLLILPQCYLS